MTMLKTNLEKLYQRNPSLDQLYPFDETYEKLNYFIDSEVKNGKKFLNPYRFSKVFNIELSKVFVLFVYISSINDNRTLELKYRYTCKNNTAVFLSEDELENFICDEDCGCEEEFNLREAIESEAIDVPIFFEIDAYLISNILSSIEDESSFSERDEGGMFNESINKLKVLKEEIDLLEEHTDDNQMIIRQLSQLEYLTETANRVKLR